MPARDAGAHFPANRGRMGSNFIRCILFDFADTLCSELYFTQLGPEFQSLATEAIFAGRNKSRWSVPWCRGTLTSKDIAEHLSQLTEINPKRIPASLDEKCSHLEFNPNIWRFAQRQRAQGRHTAIVSINFDVFSRVVVSAHKFDRIFDVVVNSADYGVDDKIVLCAIAFSRLEGCTFDNSLLIDDQIKNVEAFRKRGGMAHQYTNDDKFLEWERKWF